VPPKATTSRPLLRSERGQTVVEFALVAPILVILVFGIVQVASAFNWWNDLNQIAGEGARAAAVNRPLDPTKVGASVATLASDLKEQGDSQGLRTAMTVCFEFPGGKTLGSPVVVRAKATYPWFAKVLGAGIATTNLEGKAVMRLERASTIAGPLC
jgi:Flp pilus assembly protein TadG